MNKNLLLVLLVSIFFGCADDVEFNNPAVQANFESQSWRGVAFSAATQDGGLVIRAIRGTETLLLFTTRTDAGDYPLGGTNQSEARYTAADGTVYSTLNNQAPNPPPVQFTSDGLITITNVDLVNNTATGEFWFNAFTADGLNSVNFIDGVFFRVPILQNISETTGGTTCALATDVVAMLQTQVMGGAPSTSLCSQLEAALEIQLLSCGDASGDIQAILDTIDCNDDDGDGIPNSFEDVDMDGNLDNDDTDMDGTPNYLDDDDDNDGLLTILDIGDSDGDGIPNHLERDDDNDGILTQFEDPFTPLDTDGDGIINSLDNDDDGDGILTINENPDPNGDGDPSDALDTDMDGTPDYLQN
ncbi:DUF6252 family protein [Winogradskyella haliclonae]|uniref:Thrombospondin type 3 repeat-containing protein n=1 Tax=Winogradskyella haliclonae TaxID=2048558 RepID=A0ABQ2BWH3_9FLAO|nr:DUF6252 family protein [Winogradskyella haliclonae]GGI55878.1 hypothetical protein GCM10011444_01870 [Winogradskyella haliclonae]